MLTRATLARSATSFRRAPEGMMSLTGLEVFDRTIHHTNLWLLEIEGELGINQRTTSWHVLRVVLGALRDRLPVEEAAHLSAQLPLLVRGVFFEGWRPAVHVRVRTREELVARVRAEMQGIPVDAERACRAVFATLQRHVTPGELADVRDVLPADLKGFLEPA